MGREITRLCFLKFKKSSGTRLNVVLFVFAWKCNNTRNTISIFLSQISFIFLIAPIDSSNDQNICVEFFMVTFTHLRLNYALKKKLETALSSLLYEKHFQNLEGRDLNLLGSECIVW